MVKSRKIGQITIKKIGNCYAACISGTPKKLFNVFRDAEIEIERLRKKYGRRHYPKKKKKR